MSQKRSIFTLSIAITFLFITACTPQTKKHDDRNKLNVTTTTTMITDLVENVGGEYVQVTGLMGPGVDPHLYKASQGDISKLSKADIIFYNGLHLEGKMTSIFEKMSRKKPVVSISNNIEKKSLIQSGDHQYDPHIWFDVRLWIKATQQVSQSLAEIDPSHKKEFEQQAASYIQELEQLHSDVKKQIHSIPQTSRVLVTAHDAFSYFGRAYQMEVVGLQGISTVSEYGLKDVAHLVTLLTDRKVKAVFIESSVPKRSIEAVVHGALKKNHTVQIGGQLYSDAMGPKGSLEGNYIGMVRHNVNTIVHSLK